MMPLVVPGRSGRVRSFRAGTLAAVLTGTLAFAGSLPARADIPEIRPIGAAERRAVELAVLYLAEGPSAWWPLLAADSPLREMGEALAVDEIAVRAGPPEGARWVLQTPAPGSPDGLAVFSITYPSGIEETLTLRLVAAEAGWRIREIRSLADLSRLDTAFEVAGAAVPASAPSVPVARPPVFPVSALLLALAAGLVGSLGFGGRRLGVVGVCGLAATGVLLACAPRERAVDEPSAGAAVVFETPADGFQSLGDLRELRWALAAGAPPESVDELAARVPAGEDIARLVSLWRAETELYRADLGPAQALLESLPDPSPLPLGDLLRARLAFVRGRGEAMQEHYEQVGRSGTDHDGLRFEAAQALLGLGWTIQADRLVERTAEMGSRLAEVSYTMAAMSALSGEMNEGAEYLARAWAFEPVPREVLFGDPLLAALCARPSLFPTFSFGAPEEPLVASEARGRETIELPAGATADLSGELLRIELGDAELFVPGGGALAPEGVTLESAGDRRARVETKVLGRLPALLDASRAGGVAARPRRVREMTEAATALARHRRWDELVALTDGISGSVEVVPPVLGQLRAVALRQTGRTGAAQSLLVRLAKTSLESRRKDPGALRQLAELFVAERDYDLAIRLMERAESLSPWAANDVRVRQVRLEQELYQDAERHATDHFAVVYPRSTGTTYAGDLGIVLEEELQRISHWIPLHRAARGEPHTVHLYPLLQFLDAYSGGMLVLGLYDGRLNVPFAELRSLHPELVAVLSHELAHAMLARATDDQAPKWLHEGLAQHIEMVPGRINPIPDLHREGRVLSFPMIEAILAGFAEPQLVELAYAEAAWVVHYVEAVHGVRAIRRLVESYAGGATTEEALAEVFGMTVAEFDTAVWEWCLEDAPVSWPTSLRRYDQEAGRLARVTLREWHGRYTEASRGTKRSLAAVVGPLRQGRLPDPGVCDGLARQVGRMLEDPRALRPPLPEVRQHLRLAFRSLRDLAVSCQQGDAAASREALRLAESALGRAAVELETYGLSP